MKKVMFIAALMMAVLPTEAQQVKYTINGISKDNGKTVSLIDRKTNQTVNTATVVDGKFTMNGNAEKDAFMAIGIKENPWATIFFNDGTPMTINLNDSTLKGSPLNERLVRYDIDINAPYANYMIKIQSMSEEERKAKEMELAGGLMIAMMKMMTGVEKVFKEERETLVPVAFISEYQQMFGQQKLDSVLATKPVWASHPIVKSLVDHAAQQKALEEKKLAFIGKQFIDLEEADAQTERVRGQGQMGTG